jgi:hypothetical protein
MTSRTAILSAVSAGCIAAAAAGGFYAVSLSSAPAPAVEAVPSAPLPMPTTPEPVATDAAAATAATDTRLDTPVEAPPSNISAGTPKPESRPAVDRAAGPDRRTEAPAATPPAAPPASRSTASAPPASVPALPPPVTLDPAAASAADVAWPPPPVAEPERPRFVELVVPEDSVIGLRLESELSTDTAAVEDLVSALVTRDVAVDGRIAIPADARLEGYVISVDRGGRFRERARLGIRFTTLVLGGTTKVRIDTEAIYRDGESPTGEATAKIGASAVVGSILGAVIGGKKGAAIGGAAGAAGGTAVVVKGDRHDAVFAAGSSLTVRLSKPLSILVERDQR